MIGDIRQALSGPLPGIAGQIKMAPQPLPENVDRWHRPDNSREAGVLLLLYPHGSNHREPKAVAPGPELHIILIRRTESLGVHSGQISFPGGRRERHEALLATALRETWEEIGVVPETVEIIGQLSPLYVPASNFYIYPFVAYSPVRPTFLPDPAEVAELIELPLNLLLDSTMCKQEVRHLQNYGERLIPFFDVFGHRVWGATAMMLGEFLTLLQEQTGN